MLEANDTKIKEHFLAIADISGSNTVENNSSGELNIQFELNDPV